MREPQEGDRLVCPKCPVTVEVSTEDPDASVSDMWSHIERNHTPNNPDTRLLLRRVKLVDKNGRVLPA